MKKLFCLLILVTAIGVAQANLAVNGDFEDGTVGWVQWWGGNSMIPVADPVEGDNAAGVWWTADGILQDINIGPGTYEVSGNLLQSSAYPLVDGRIGVIQVEMSDGSDLLNPWWIQQIIVDGSAPLDTWISGNTVIDNRTAGATVMRINLFLIDGGPDSYGTMHIDNVYVGTPSKARFPNPTDGEIVPPNIDDISWIMPDPNMVGNTVTCDVYFEPNDLDPYNFGSGPIATGVTNGTVNLTTAGVTVLPNTIYTWRVDCTDPSQKPDTTQGDVWFFETTNDNAPIADAGPDQYNWWGMDDGDGDPAKITVAMAGDVTDDGNSTLTTLWTLIYSEQALETTVNIIDTASQTTTVEIDGTGLFRFQLDADDAYNHSDDIVEIFITETACDAAQIDPDDHYQTYAYVGDTNNDCMVNMTDLAIMASTWLDCLTDKIGCTP